MAQTLSHHQTSPKTTVKKSVANVNKAWGNKSCPMGQSSGPPAPVV